MDDKVKNDFSNLMTYSTYIDLITAVIHYAAKSEQVGLFDRLNDLLSEFMVTLSEEQKEELGTIIGYMIAQKSKSLIALLERENLSEEEIQELLKSMQPTKQD